MLADKPKCLGTAHPFASSPQPRHSRAGGDPDWLVSRVQPQAFEGIDPRLRGDDGGILG